jgi:hypothetical protein
VQVAGRQRQQAFLRALMNISSGAKARIVVNLRREHDFNVIQAPAREARFSAGEPHARASVLLPR